MALYGSKDYWDERYNHSGDLASYEWFHPYSELRHLLSTDSLTANGGNYGYIKAQSRHFPEDGSGASVPANTGEAAQPSFPSYQNCRILILGCGNSKFAEDMREDGWGGPIVNVDFSSVVIDQMKKRYEKQGYHDTNDVKVSMQKTSFVCADVNEGLPFEDESFHLVIMKGTLDAIVCGNGGTYLAKKVIAECSRCLGAGGCLFVVSHGNSDSRIEFFERDNDISYYWQNVSIHNLPRNGGRMGSKSSYVYICCKHCGVGNEDEPTSSSKLPVHSFEENVSSSSQAPYKSMGS